MILELFYQPRNLPEVLGTSFHHIGDVLKHFKSVRKLFDIRLFQVGQPLFIFRNHLGRVLALLMTGEVLPLAGKIIFGLIEQCFKLVAYLIR